MRVVFRGYSDSHEIEDAFSSSPFVSHSYPKGDRLREASRQTLGKLNLLQKGDSHITFDLSQLKWLSPALVVAASVSAISAAQLGKRVALEIAAAPANTESSLNRLAALFQIGGAWEQLAGIIDHIAPVSAAADRPDCPSYLSVNTPLQVITPVDSKALLGTLSQEKLHGELEALLGASGWGIVEGDEIADTVAYELLDNAFSHGHREGTANLAVACSYTRKPPPNTSVKAYVDHRIGGSGIWDADFYRCLGSREDPTFFEFSIGDPGWGIVPTLAEAFWADRDAEDLAKDVEYRWQLDRAVLEYAFLPWSTSRTSFATRTHQWLPRGLHRLKRSALRYGGMVSIRSGSACVSFVPKQNTADGVLKANDEKLACVPGTCVTVRIPVHRKMTLFDLLPSQLQPGEDIPCQWHAVAESDITGSSSRRTRRPDLREVESCVRRFTLSQELGKVTTDVMCIDTSHAQIEPDPFKEFISSLLDIQSSTDSLILFCHKEQVAALTDFGYAREAHRTEEGDNSQAEAQNAPWLQEGVVLPCVVVDKGLDVLWAGATSEEQALLTELRSKFDIDEFGRQFPHLNEGRWAQLMRFAQSANLATAVRSRSRSLLLDLLNTHDPTSGVHHGYFRVPSGRYVSCFVHMPHLLGDPLIHNWIVSALALDLATVLKKAGIRPHQLVLFSCTQSTRSLVRDVAAQLGIQGVPWQEGYFQRNSALPDEVRHAEFVGWLTDVIGSGGQTANVTEALSDERCRGVWIGTCLDLRGSAHEWQCGDKEISVCSLAEKEIPSYASLPDSWDREKLLYVHPVTLNIQRKPIGDELEYPLQDEAISLFGKRGVLKARPIKRNGRLNLYYCEAAQMASAKPEVFAGALVAEIKRRFSGDGDNSFLNSHVHVLLSDPALACLSEPLEEHISTEQIACSYKADVTVSYVQKLHHGIRFARHSVDAGLRSRSKSYPSSTDLPDMAGQSVLYVDETFVDGHTLKRVIHETVQCGAHAVMAAALVSRLPYTEEWFLRHASLSGAKTDVSVTCLSSMRIGTESLAEGLAYNRALQSTLDALPPRLRDLCKSEIDSLQMSIEEADPGLEASCYGPIPPDKSGDFIQFSEEQARRAELVRHKCYLRERLGLLEEAINIEDLVIEDALRKPSNLDHVIVEILAEEPRLRSLPAVSRDTDALRHMCLNVISQADSYQYQRVCAVLLLDSLGGDLLVHLRDVLLGVAPDDTLAAFVAAHAVVQALRQKEALPTITEAATDYRNAALTAGAITPGKDKVLLLLDAAVSWARSYRTFNNAVEPAPRPAAHAIRTLQKFYFDREKAHMSDFWSILSLPRQLQSSRDVVRILQHAIPLLEKLEDELSGDILPSIEALMPCIRGAHADRTRRVMEIAVAIQEPRGLLDEALSLRSALCEMLLRLEHNEDANVERFLATASTAIASLGVQVLRLQRTETQPAALVKQFLRLAQCDLMHALRDAIETVTNQRGKGFHSLLIDVDGIRPFDVAGLEIPDSAFGKAFVLGDTDSIRVIFENLLDNALAYAFRSKERRNARIEVGCESRENVAVAITDFGSKRADAPGVGLNACRRRIGHWLGEMLDLEPLPGTPSGHRIQFKLVRGFCPPPE